MKKKNTALIRALLIVSVIAMVSWLALKVVNKEIDPSIPLAIDVAEIGQKLLQAMVDFVVSLINPERRSFLN